MSSTGFLSAEELMKYRERSSNSIPDACKKGDQQGTCSKEEVTKYYDAVEQLMSEERVAKEGSLCRAELDWITKKIRLTKQVGKSWHKMGYSENGNMYLHPEEAYYLIDTGDLELYCNNVPLSVQEAQAMLFVPDVCKFEHYQTYSHLKRQGCIVIRYKDAPEDKLKGNSIMHQKNNNVDEVEVVGEKEQVASTCTPVLSSDEEQSGSDGGISIVYESLPNKRIKIESDILDEEELPSNGAMEVDASTSGENDSHFDFPNVAGIYHGKYELPVPPPHLLPPNVLVTKPMCTVNIENLWNLRNERSELNRHERRDWNYDKTPWERKHARYDNYRGPRKGYMNGPSYIIQNVSNFQNQTSRYANNTTFTRTQYSEFPSSSNDSRKSPAGCTFNVFQNMQQNNTTHQKMFEAIGSSTVTSNDVSRTRDLNCNQREDNSSFGNRANVVPTANNWKEHKQQLEEIPVHYGDVLTKLQCIKNEDSLLSSNDDNSTTTTLKITYDVHLASTPNFKKSNPPQPNHRVVILRSTDEVPDLLAISQLHEKSNNVPIRFAVVHDNGAVSFQSFTSNNLPVIE